jgi:hypothetical protein
MKVISSEFDEVLSISRLEFRSEAVWDHSSVKHN